MHLCNKTSFSRSFKISLYGILFCMLMFNGLKQMIAKLLEIFFSRCGNPGQHRAGVGPRDCKAGSSHVLVVVLHNCWCVKLYRATVNHMAARWVMSSQSAYNGAYDLFYWITQAYSQSMRQISKYLFVYIVFSAHRTPY